MSKGFAVFVAVLGLTLDLGKPAQGQGKPPAYTVIAVEKMHCDGCAQRISGKLQEVPAVEKVQFDVEKKVLWVHPQTGKQPSPRALWEAVEKARDRPLWLQGPLGTFKNKPQ